MRPSALLIACTACVAALGLHAREVRAQTADGLYGRLTGDLVLSAEVTAGALVGDTARPSVGAVLRGRWLDMTGAAIGYTRAASGDRWDAVWAAVDFRPAMLARWSSDLEHGPRWLDLLLDSIGVEIGGAWLRPGRSLGQGGGFGMVLGGGFELPLRWVDGDGVMLRLGVRWVNANPWDAQGTGRDDGAVECSAAIVLRSLVRSGWMPRR